MRKTEAFYELDSGELLRFKIEEAHYSLLSNKPQPLTRAQTPRCSLTSNIHPRKIVVKAVDGSGEKRIAILSKADWNSSTFSLGQTITYQGKQWVITEKIPEKIY